MPAWREEYLIAEYVDQSHCVLVKPLFAKVGEGVAGIAGGAEVPDVEPALVAWGVIKKFSFVALEWVFLAFSVEIEVLKGWEQGGVGWMSAEEGEDE
jgi:hypothetical protein